MRIIRPDLARRSLELLKSTLDWPYYGKFVYVSSVDLAVVADGNLYWHIDLVRFIRADVENDTGKPFLITDEDVFLGIIEWDEDGNVRITTTSRPRAGSLPVIVRSELLNQLAAL